MSDSRSRGVEFNPIISVGIRNVAFFSPTMNRVPGLIVQFESLLALLPAPYHKMISHQLSGMRAAKQILNKESTTNLPTVIEFNSNFPTYYIYYLLCCVTLYTYAMLCIMNNLEYQYKLQQANSPSWTSSRYHVRKLSSNESNFPRATKLLSTPCRRGARKKIEREKCRENKSRGGGCARALLRRLWGLEGTRVH